MVDNMAEQNTNPDLRQGSADGKRHDRRRFLGAGAAAAPFLLTLVSQPALGTTCFTPSRSLSRNTSVSQQGNYGECLNAQSLASYAALPQTVASMGGAWPDALPPDTSMNLQFSPLPAQFFKQVNEGGTMVSKAMTLGEALQVPGADQAYFYLIAAYLNKMGGGGASIPDAVLTASDIRGIWQEYAMQGYYEPMAGIQWSASDIVNYLISNGVVG